ncbi:hypothetical protein DSO57_1009457 [Entomophthora muscae]|uniref:Uncharacterized protein n=1 Tax=Entomophthora muscae TaxID=34485 RepID=A0ACC2TIQ6_9FUNG|nr:hypothetical protein DSO57_1009457 [Entomophthora muscae]
MNQFLLLSSCLAISISGPFFNILKCFSDAKHDVELTSQACANYAILPLNKACVINNESCLAAGEEFCSGDNKSYSCKFIGISTLEK